MDEPSKSAAQPPTPHLDRWAASMAADVLAVDAEQRSQKADLWFDMVLEWAGRAEHCSSHASGGADEAAQRTDAADLAAQVDNLKRALQTNRKIGAAIGILMASGKLKEEAAFELLTHVSQRSQRKLRDVADEVVRTGMLPATASLPRSRLRPARSHP